MIYKEAIVAQLREVVDAVKAANKDGIACLLPDVVLFEDEVVSFEVPLQDDMDVAVAEMERAAAKATYSYPGRGN